MKIFAVVPTYNRPKLLLKNIKCLLEQTYDLSGIILVNNGSDPSTEVTLRDQGLLSHPKIKYVYLQKNIGASGGFSVGMQKAMSVGADWIWGMDDDAFPEPDALENLLNVMDKAQSHCFWSNVDEDNNFTRPVKVVDKLIFVGFFLSRKLVAKVGYPDRRYFMYHDDTDYSRRIISAGYHIIKVRDSVIDHSGYNSRGTPIQKVKLPFKSITLLAVEPYRLYYIYRNQFYIEGSIWRKLRFLTKTLLVDIPKYLTFRPRSGLAVTLAALHILVGKRGEIAMPSWFS